MWISFKRILKIGWKEFSRNMALTVATIFIMTMVIILVSALYFLSPVSQKIISDIEDKVDISVYFNEEAEEKDIIDAQLEISKLSEVKKAEYISKDEALRQFIENHKDEPELIESLTELGYNPFLPCLNIKTVEPLQFQYEEVANFLENSSYGGLIEKVDYYQRKSVIEKALTLTEGIRKTGFFLSIIFGLIAVLIVFNSIKIAIYNSREEISVMKLVGASNSFVRGPFIIQAIITGFISAVLSLIIIFILIYFFDAKIKSIVPNISMFNIFLNNLAYLFLIQLATGVGLSIISSCLAIKKYLKA